MLLSVLLLVVVVLILVLVFSSSGMEIGAPQSLSLKTGLSEHLSVPGCHESIVLRSTREDC